MSTLLVVRFHYPTTWLEEIHILHQGRRRIAGTVERTVFGQPTLGSFVKTINSHFSQRPRRKRWWPFVLKLGPVARMMRASDINSGLVLRFYSPAKPLAGGKEGARATTEYSICSQRLKRLGRKFSLLHCSLSLSLARPVETRPKCQTGACTDCSFGASVFGS